MRRRSVIARLLLGLLALALITGACSSTDSGSTDTTSTTGDATPTSSGDTGSTESGDVDLQLGVAGDEPIAELDPRFLSYNVEMVEVTGGAFWPPYGAGDEKVIRPPIDLGSERLRNLTRALGPAYIRVSGTWANHTQFVPDGTVDTEPDPGFDGVLTGDQWRGVGEFARAVDGLVVTSFAVSDGTRDADGRWLDTEARRRLAFDSDEDIPVVGIEFVNEPSFPIGVPAGYDADAYARDFEVFRDVMTELAPDVAIVGPSAASDARTIVIEPTIGAEDIMDRTGPVDVFSYHVYPKVSARCANDEDPAIAFDVEFLERIGIDKAFYDDLRDRTSPDSPMWITEIAQAACGGDEWAATWRDVVRFVDALGRIGDEDDSVLFHNTLAASDYGLLDEDGFVPRPNYWAAVLWADLMGPTVLQSDVDASAPDDLLVYAHCTPEPGGRTFAVLNSSPTETRTVSVGSDTAELRLLTGESVDGTTTLLNGTVLEEAEDGTLPALDAVATDGPIDLPPTAVAFITETVDDGPCA